MSSKYDVTIFQSIESQCAPNGESCPCLSSTADEIVAYNLLESTNARRGWQRVGARPVISWFGNYNLVPLAFREKPPKISESFLQAISDRRDETQDSSSETLLQEFCPKYGRSLNDGGDDDSVGAATPVDENPRLGAQVDPGRSREPTTEDLASCSRTLGLYESVWCACPKLKQQSPKSKGMKLSRFKETNLEQVRCLYKVNPWQRGKWILKGTPNPQKGRCLPLEDLWTKVCRFIKGGDLPHCNARYKKKDLEVWLYCDFIHSLKVRSILADGLGNIGVLPFSIHPHGIIMTL